MMDKARMRELAEVAYAAYGKVTGGVNYQGLPMPDFADLGEKIQTAWDFAAGAVAQAVVADNTRADANTRTQMAPPR